jgi:hypothetical protein
MNTRTTNLSALELLLGSFGIALIALLAWACEPESEGGDSLLKHGRRAAGWLVIRSVVAIGSAIDRIAPVEVDAEGNGVNSVHDGCRGAAGG